MTQIIENVVSPWGNGLWDNLRVTVEQGRITQVENGVPQAQASFLRAGEPPAHPATTVAQRVVSWDEGLAAAVDLLAARRAPLLLGLAESSTPGVREAINLMELLGGTIDPASPSSAAATLALQQVGLSTCTLGEVKNRADLIVFWGADAVTSHPGLIERFAVEPAGEFVPHGRADRTVIVIDADEQPTSRLADLFVRATREHTASQIQLLRQLVAGKPLNESVQHDCGVSIESLQILAEKLRACRCGVIFFGEGMTKQPHAARAIELLYRLVRELNAVNRFHARYLPSPGDLGVAANVLTWQTGFPQAVNFALGYPRYSPGEFSAEAQLASGEADCAIVVGAEACSPLSTAALEHLAKIPTILLDSGDGELPTAAHVRFQTAKYGLHLSGTLLRLDEVPLPLTAILPTDLPSDEQILRALAVQLSSLKQNVNS